MGIGSKKKWKLEQAVKSMSRENKGRNISISIVVVGVGSIAPPQVANDYESTSNQLQINFKSASAHEPRVADCFELTNVNDPALNCCDGMPGSCCINLTRRRASKQSFREHGSSRGLAKGQNRGFLSSVL